MSQWTLSRHLLYANNSIFAVMLTMIYLEGLTRLISITDPCDRNAHISDHIKIHNYNLNVIFINTSSHSLPGGRNTVLCKSCF